MAQLISAKLSRFDASPWGFRLQGGKDFGQPLVIQKVNGNSPAEKAGLQAGDALIKVNNVELFNLNHKDAQNAIVRAGNNFELIIQRGGSTWKPSVTPVGPAPTVQSGGNIQPVTKTSLAYKGPSAPQPNAYNAAPRPFGGSQINGETIKSITSKQYNTPVALYSEETIAETLSAQAEVLAGGVLGVNFKKNEKTYNAANSEVLKMVQEIDKEPREQEPDIATPQIAAPTTPKVSNVPVSSPLSGLRHVSAPEPKPQPAQDPLKVLPPGQNICADCERLIVGLFVRIKDKNLHVECFKCATCGTSLKNVGYYNINNKLYCDVHAKMIARQNPPAPNLEPVTIPPGGKAPSSVIASSIAAAPAPFQSQFSTPSAAAPGSPQPGTLAPLPFHAPYLGIRHVNAPRNYFYPHKTPASNIQAPKLNLSQPAPKVNFNQPTVPSPLTRPQSDVVQEGSIQYQSYSTLSQSSFESKSENVRFEQSTEIKNEAKMGSSSSFSAETREVIPQTQKKMSICSQEIGKMHMDAQSMVKHLTEILEDSDRCPSPTPIDEAKNLAKLETEPSQNQINEEAIQRLEQEQQWANYQAEAGKEIVNQHLSKVKETGVAFLRSHSTPVSELEALYEQQQKEIESQAQRIISLGTAKDQEVDDERKKEIEEQIIASQKQIIESQEKQKEIERKKHVRFQEEAEVKRRESLQVQQIEFEGQRRIREAQQIEQEQRRRYEEAQRRNVEEKQQAADQQHLLSLESLRERARTPVANLEAYERDDEMSPKTEKIFHTYEQLIQSEDEIQAELVVKPETPKIVPIRPLTPARGVSPFPGSIPLAEKSLLLKNIQGIEFEFAQANPKKPEPKIFKLPDLRNLGKTKPLTFAQAPSVVEAPKPQEPKPIIEVKKTEVELREQLEFQQKQQLIQQQLKEVEEKRKQTELEEQRLLTQNQCQEQTVVDQKKIQIQQEKLQQQQIKEQRKQVHEELAQNERFKRKQETLGPPKPAKFERSKTPVAELEELDRQRGQSERTKQIYSSYDQVIQSEECPVPEAQTISDAEKSLFFQNIQGIDYKFESITESFATKHLAEHEKSQIVKTIENRTISPINVGVNSYTKLPIELTQPPKQSKPDIYQSAFVNALTTMPDAGTRQLKTQKSYEEYKEEQERLFQQQKLEQQMYFEQQRQLQQQKQKAVPTNLVSALTIAPDRPYSPLPSAPATIPQKVPFPEQTAPYNPPEQIGETKSLIDALTIAPEKPFAPQVFDAGSIDNTILNTERIVEVQSEQRRQSIGFPGVNVQRTPYQMLKGDIIKTAFEEDLKSQETAINQFLSKKSEETFKSASSVVESSITQQYQSYSQESSSSMQESIVPGFGLVQPSPQIAYAPPPPAEKRAELLASQVQFGSKIETKPEKPKQEPKPLSRPMTMIEALTTAPERAYSPFAEVPKPPTTLVCGGAAVALTKGQTLQREALERSAQSRIEVTPMYQVKDVQLSKDKIGATGFSEQKREQQQEAGIIKGEGMTGTYQKSEQKFESVQQTSSEKKGQKIEIPPLPLPPIIEQDTPKEVVEMKTFPPVSDQLKSETKQSVQSVQQASQSVQQKASITQQSASFSQSSIQQSSSQQVSQKVSRSEDSTKVVERRVTEVIEHESSRKEFSQVKMTGNIDPRTGLRRTSSENFLQKSHSSQLATSGLQKPSSIPMYQSLLSDQPVVETVPVGAVESKNFPTRPRSVHGLQPSKSTDRLSEKAQEAKVPLAFRSRTPVPLPTVSFHGEPAKAADQAPKNRHFPTYNQTEVYRSASPRPIPVPKQQLGTYFGQAAPKQTLQPGPQSVYRSASPVPVPKLLGSAEKYQQPVTRRNIQPKEQPQPRVSWPPQASSEPIPTSQFTPKKIGEQPVVTQQPSRPKSAGKKVSWPPQEVTAEVLRQEDLPENLHTQNIVKEQIHLQEQQALKQTKTLVLDTQKKSTQSLISKTDTQSKGPAPKSDPITAPRPFGTPTPQRKIATPHFQPIKPVAITQGQSTNITAPKLTFSSTKSTSIISETNLERKTSLTNSSDSAFKPIDVSPIKPTPFKPLSTFVNANIDTAVLPSMNGLAKSNVPPSNVQKPTQNIQSSVQNIQKSIPMPDPIGKEPPNKQGSEVDKSGNSGGGAGGAKGATFAGATTPRRGKGVLNPPNAMRIPLCASCNGQIRGPFITALGKIWCPEHFICTNAQCRRPLADIGFVEEEGKGLFCEFCFEKYIAPNCDKCTKKIKGDCLNAIGKHFHPECFNCAYCGKLFGNSPFFLEDGLPYCEADWNELFTTKCFACGFPIEAGDRWVEALNNNYHSQCFNCTMCKTNLEGQSFYAKGGRPFCKTHAR